MVDKKICKNCGVSKELSEFHRHSFTADGHRSICKLCKKILRHQEYLKNKNRENKLSRLWKQNNKERMKVLNKRHNYNRQEYLKNYRMSHRKQRAENERKRRKNNPNYNIDLKLRHRLTEALKSQQVQKTNKALQLLGCSLDDFRLHLQLKFKEGMSWENYGKWHIDHIKPCAKFDLSNDSQQKICFHYSNMQPLWAKENQEKWMN